MILVAVLLIMFLQKKLLIWSCSGRFSACGYGIVESPFSNFVIKDAKASGCS
jgi:hypothetical protein